MNLCSKVWICPWRVKKAASFPKSHLFWGFFNSWGLLTGFIPNILGRIYINSLNYSVFPDDNLNFGIKTLEEIKLKKLKEKAKKQGGELISLKSLLFNPPFCSSFCFILIFLGEFTRERIFYRGKNLIIFCNLGHPARTDLHFFFGSATLAWCSCLEF